MASGFSRNGRAACSSAIGIGVLPHLHQARVLRLGGGGISHRLGGPRDTGDRLGPARRASQRLLEVLARLGGLAHLHQHRSIQLVRRE